MRSQGIFSDSSSFHFLQMETIFLFDILEKYCKFREWKKIIILHIPINSKWLKKHFDMVSYFFAAVYYESLIVKNKFDSPSLSYMT